MLRTICFPFPAKCLLTTTRKKWPTGSFQTKQACSTENLSEIAALLSYVSWDCLLSLTDFWAVGAEGVLVCSTQLDIAQRHFASFFLDNMPGKKKRNLKIQTENCLKQLQHYKRWHQKTWLLKYTNTNGRGYRNDIAMSISSSSLMEKGCQEESQTCYDASELDNCFTTKVFLWFLEWVFWPLPYCIKYSLHASVPTGQEILSMGTSQTVSSFTANISLHSLSDTRQEDAETGDNPFSSLPMKFKDRPGVSWKGMFSSKKPQRLKRWKQPSQTQRTFRDSSGRKLFHQQYPNCKT